MSDQIWEEFRRTFLRIRVADGVVEVRPGAIAERGAFLAGQDGPLHVLTACNPQGVETSAAANEAENARLRAELDARGLRVWPTTGHGTDRCGRESDWSEPGFTVAGMTTAEALALACRYDQAAIFEWRDEPGGFHLVACDRSVDESRGWSAALVPRGSAAGDQ